ncbi:MAG TPA: hypothetical protein VND15_00320 [Candidatus Acidoferrales bacterium]|nr:hypothetical protein [Candidatus Acidoferrales bacterium]
MAIVEPKEELSKMDLLLISSLSRQFKYSEDTSKRIVKLYLTPGRVDGQIARGADRTLLEEIKIRKFLDLVVQQNREEAPKSKSVEEHATTTATISLRKVETVTTQTPAVKVQKSAYKLNDEDIRVTTKKQGQTITKQATPAKKTAPKDVFPLKRTAPKVVTSKDSRVIDVCNRFDLEQVKAEKAIESYEERFNGIHDMEKIAGISSGKASGIYNYLSSIGMKRNPLTTVEESKRKLKSTVH